MFRRRKCRPFADSLTRALDSGVVDLDLRRHMRGCRKCSQEFTQYRRINRAMHTLAAVVPAPTGPLRRIARKTRHLLLGGAAGSVCLAVAGWLIASAKRQTSK
jgi:hypothetical protein